MCKKKFLKQAIFHNNNKFWMMFKNYPNWPPLGLMQPHSAKSWWGTASLAARTTPDKPAASSLTRRISPNYSPPASAAAAQLSLLGRSYSCTWI